MLADFRGWCLAASFACSSLTSQAAGDPPEVAFALADAMQVTVTVRLTAEARAQKDIASGRSSQEELDCLKSADFSVVRVPYAEALTRSLTEKELNAALQFFSKPQGRRYLQYSIQQQMVGHGLPTSETVEPLSDRELETVGAFAISSAGDKIFSKLETPELRDQLFKRLYPILSQCRTQKSSADSFALLSPQSTSPADASGREDKSAAASYDEVYQLVRAMREDEFTTLALRQRIPEYGDKLSKQEAACLTGIEPTRFTEAIARPLVGKLSAAEVADALAFYRSTAGQQFMKAWFDEMKLGKPRAPLTEYVTADQGRELVQFLKRPVARKLMAEKLTQQEDVMKSIEKRMTTLYEECARK